MFVLRSDGRRVRFLAAGVAGTICNACCLRPFVIFLGAVRYPFRVR